MLLHFISLLYFFNFFQHKEMCKFRSFGFLGVSKCENGSFLLSLLSFTFAPHVGRSMQSSATTISKEKKTNKQQSSASSDLLGYFFSGLN